MATESRHDWPDEWVISDTGIPLLPPYGEDGMKLAGMFARACAFARARLDAERLSEVSDVQSEDDEEMDIRSLE